MGDSPYSTDRFWTKECTSSSNAGARPNYQRRDKYIVRVQHGWKVCSAKDKHSPQ